MQAWPSGKAWRWHSFQLGLEPHQSPRVFCNADSLQHFTILPLLPVTTNFITTSITTFIIAYLTDITPYYFSSPLCYYYSTKFGNHGRLLNSYVVYELRASIPLPRASIH